MNNEVEVKWFLIGTTGWGVKELMPNSRPLSEATRMFNLPPLPTSCEGNWRVGDAIDVADDPRKFYVASNGIAGNPLYAYPAG